MVSNVLLTGCDAIQEWRKGPPPHDDEPADCVSLRTMTGLASPRSLLVLPTRLAARRKFRAERLGDLPNVGALTLRECFQPLRAIAGARVVSGIEVRDFDEQALFGGEVGQFCTPICETVT